MGGVEKYNLTQAELAILASSHSGEPIHVETVTSILHKLGLTPDILNCGAARPMSGKAFKELVRQNLKPSALHNPCSGKHLVLSLYVNYLKFQLMIILNQTIQLKKLFIK